MPWAKQTITIDGESVEAMAKVSSENGTGSVELPFDSEDKYKVNQEVSIAGDNFSIEEVSSRQQEITTLKISKKENKKKTKKKKEIEVDV